MEGVFMLEFNGERVGGRGSDRERAVRLRCNDESALYICGPVYAPNSDTLGIGGNGGTGGTGGTVGSARRGLPDSVEPSWMAWWPSQGGEAIVRCVERDGKSRVEGELVVMDRKPSRERG